MAYSRIKVLKPIKPPKPVTHLRVRHVDTENEEIYFFATRQAIREIDDLGFGMIRQAAHGNSGWCVLIANGCYVFDDVLQWFLDQTGQKAEDLEYVQEAA